MPLPLASLALLLGTHTGHAAVVSDLRPAWPEGQTRRVHIESVVATPQLFRIELPGGKGVRVTIFEVEYVASCAVETERAAEWALRCDLEDVRLAAQPIREELDRIDILQGILDNYTRRLEGAWLQVELGKDGRLRHFDIEGAQETMLGDRKETELLRRLFRQGFAGLELQVPARVPAKAASWQTKNPRHIEHLAWPGTNAHAAIDNEITQTDGDRVWVSYAGEGAMRPAQRRFLYLHTVGELIVNTTLGGVEEARWAGVATHLPSHIFAWTELTRPYLYWGQARVAPPNATVELGDNGPLGDVTLPPELKERLEPTQHQGGKLTAPGQALEQRDGFGWGRIGASTSALAPAPFGTSWDLHGGLGLQMKSDIWAGVGARLHLFDSDLPADTRGRVQRADHALTARVTWSPLARVSPELGIVAGVGYRTWATPEGSWELAPLAGPELGVRVEVGHGVWVSGWMQTTLDIVRLGPGGRAEYGVSPELLDHRAGVSLVLGRGD